MKHIVLLSFVFYSYTCLIVPAQVEEDRSFSFMALGCTAYNGEPDYEWYRELIRVMNELEPAFSIHVGDIFGSGECPDEKMHQVLSFFDRYDHPVIYTPGDNEWCDCSESLDRLSAIRRMFFTSDRSLGGTPMPLIRQSEVSDHKQMVENARWIHNDVLFVTVHVPGSENRGGDGDKDEIEQEFRRRNAANLEWLDQAFDIAFQQRHKAVVIALHAMLFSEGFRDSPAYLPTIETIRKHAKVFGGPVLLINADSHLYSIVLPFPELANVTRLQVFGAPEIRAVEVTVDPSRPDVFGFAPDSARTAYTDARRTAEHLGQLHVDQVTDTIMQLSLPRVNSTDGIVKETITWSMHPGSSVEVEPSRTTKRLLPKTDTMQHFTVTNPEGFSTWPIATMVSEVEVLGYTISREYKVPLLLRVKPTAKPPVIDGNLGAEWDGFDAGTKFRLMALPHDLSPHETETRICYDDNAIYLAFRCKQNSPIQVQHRKRDDNIWQDDSIEFMFDIDQSQGRIYQWIINAEGYVQDLHKYELDWNSDNTVTKTSQDGSTWTLEMKIAWADMGTWRPAAGTIVRSQIVRSVQGTKDVTQWSPCARGNLIRNEWGILRFE